MSSHTSGWVQQINYNDYNRLRNAFFRINFHTTQKAATFFWHTDPKIYFHCSMRSCLQKRNVPTGITCEFRLSRWPSTISNSLFSSCTISVSISSFCCPSCFSFSTAVSNSLPLCFSFCNSKTSFALLSFSNFSLSWNWTRIYLKGIHKKFCLLIFHFHEACF